MRAWAATLALLVCGAGSLSAQTFQPVAGPALEPGNLGLQRVAVQGGSVLVVSETSTTMLCHRAELGQGATLTWEPCGKAFPGQGFDELVVTPDRVLALSDKGGGVFASTDGGRKWTRVKLPRLAAGSWRMSVDDRQVVAYHGNQVQRSLDAGKTFKAVKLPGKKAELVGAAAASGEVAVATIEAAAPRFRHSRDGKRWTDSALPSAVRELTGTSGMLLLRGDRSLARSLDAGQTAQPSQLAMADQINLDALISVGGALALPHRRGVLLSHDRGLSWRTLALDHPTLGRREDGETNVRALAAGPDGLWMVTAKGVYRVTQAALEADRATPLAETTLGKVSALVGWDAALYAVDEGGLRVSFDDGQHWLASGLGPGVRGMLVHQGSLFAYGTGGVQHSVDGLRWTQLDARAVTSMAPARVEPSAGDDVIALAGELVLRRTSKGMALIKAPPIKTSALLWHAGKALAVSPGVAYALGSNDWVRSLAGAACGEGTIRGLSGVNSSVSVVWCDHGLVELDNSGKLKPVPGTEQLVVRDLERQLLATSQGVYENARGTGWTRVDKVGARAIIGVVHDHDVRIAVGEDGAVFRSLPGAPGTPAVWTQLR